MRIVLLGVLSHIDRTKMT